MLELSLVEGPTLATATFLTSGELTRAVFRYGFQLQYHYK